MPHELGSQVSWLHLPALPKTYVQVQLFRFGGAIQTFVEHQHEQSRDFGN